MKACYLILLFVFSGTIAQSDIANCVLDYNPICVVLEDCAFTLHSKCLLDFHKKFTYNKSQAPLETFTSGPCPKDKKRCPYHKYLGGKTFEDALI
ncbi:uncharacterized protein LOC27209362 [Drosophila simulans]|uniref:Uncharacterized protein, isoform A n=1 Tax=Drosophila simulans TaxID=7240 RepID=A0A0J9R3P3_DROSI|nr:uncharacterized protein LOC27209362 [Drosophila simulans]KMY90645.1 uncharacterized protein Dsimw501_GD29519, isoform A [Drosophila simulans]KMY90646.1 uncharacterized protein Dsimw501_GD29519, isoform B [Drosophila simulans]